MVRPGLSSKAAVKKSGLEVRLVPIVFKNYSEKTNPSESGLLFILEDYLAMTPVRSASNPPADTQGFRYGRPVTK